MEQQGASGWYGGSQQQQQQQQQYGGHPHQHPHPHPSVQWQVRPETTQHYNQSAQMHPSQHQHQYQQAYPTPGGYYGQPAGYYASQQHQVPQAPAPQPVVPPPLAQQHGMMYGQAEQGWSSSNGWSQQQWPLAENSTAGLSQEEEWAAKARAWAASKAAQEAQQHSQLHVQTQPDQSTSPDSLQQLPLPPPPPPPPPQPVDLPQQFAYQAHDAGIPAYGHDNSQKYGQDSSGLFGRDASSRSRGEEMKSFASEGSTSSSGLTTIPGHPLPSTSRNILELGTSSYSQDLISSHGQNAPPADFTVPPGMEQLETPQPPAPPPPAAASLPHLLHPQPPQLPSQIPPHQQTGHMQSHLPSSQFSFGESSVPASYDFHQPPPYEFQQSQSQDYLHPQPSQFNMSADVPEAGVYNGLPHPQSWPPQMPYPTNNVGPGIGAGPGLGHQFEYEFEHMHPGHQHPQHLQGHTMFARPPHGPGFRPGGPPLGHFGFGNNPTLGPGAGAGMDFSMFTDNGHGLNAGIDRPKKASVPNWLKEELLKKKAAVGGSAQLTTADDNPRANGDNIEPSTHNKFDISDRSRSDLSRMSDSDEEDEEDDTEAARTLAINQEIKRVLTEVLLKVTDDLFDEIAQEVMDEDEQRLIEDPSKKAPLAEESAKHPTPNAPVVEFASALAPAPVRVLVAPAVKLSEDDSDDDSKSLSSGAPAGNLLGLASYASDDEEAGRDSRQATESKHGNGGNSDTEASELKSFAAEKAGELHVDTEDQVVIAKEVKGKKRLSGEVLTSNSLGRSPRRARHSEVSGGEAGQSNVAASINPGVSAHKVGAIDVENPDLGTAVEGKGLQTAHVKEVTSEIKANHKTPPLNASSTERRKLEGGNDHSSKGRSDEDSSHLRRAEEAVPSDKHKHGVDIDLGKTVKERSHVNAKQGAMEAEGDGDHKNGIKREKDTNKSVKGRGREDKEKDRDRESLSGKERERSVQKIKQRERELDVEKHSEREKDKDRGRSTKARARDSDRERRKPASEKHDRKSTDHKKDKDKNSKKTRRRRSSSLSSRSRSRSRSESNSASGSRSSSPSPRRGKQQRGRSSKKPTHSSPPSRSRRRTSRSPSRSVPHSKVSHRRNSSSLSREKERNRKSRSTSPGHKRRRS